MDSLLLVQTLIFLWFFGVALSSEIDKRDVHRIIIKSRRPRRQQNYHHHHHHRPHKYGRHHSHEHRDHSYEDDSHHSRESYEEAEYKPYRHNRHHKLKPPPYPPHNNFEDTHVDGFREEWTPLLSSENKVLHHPEITHRRKRNKSRSPHYHLDIDLTTSFPRKHHYPTLYESTDFPLGEFGSFNQKTIDSKQAPFINTEAFKPNKQITNHSYDVHENVKDDVDESVSFPSALVPPLEDTITQSGQLHGVTEETIKEVKEEKPKNERKIRGRGRFRN